MNEVRKKWLRNVLLIGGSVLFLGYCGYRLLKRDQCPEIHKFIAMINNPDLRDFEKEFFSLFKKYVIKVP